MNRRSFIATTTLTCAATTWFSRFASGDVASSNSPVSATPNQWPLFRGNPSADGVAKSSLPDSLSLKWEYRVAKGAFEASAALADDRVYIGDLDGNFYALQLADGSEIWKQQPSELGFAATAGVRRNKLYVGDYDGVFYCLDAADGKILWKFETEAEINSSVNFYKDFVLFGSQDATLYCLDVRDGTQHWKYTIEDQIRCSPSIVDDRAFVAGCDAKLHVVDLTHGMSGGDVAIDGPTGATPAVRGDIVYFGTESGTFFAVDWKNAKVVWKYEAQGGNGSFRGSAAVTDEHVVVGGRSKQVYAFAPRDGALQWSFTTRRRVDSSPVVVGDRVFIGSTDGRLYALALADGKKLWEFETGGSLSASPAVASGRLVIASDDGVVYCFG
ncbi:MAG: PQQ-binding-like beta-propeller repeat protein [Planctomycetales bacterium]|nr:PQQ-binding-like beta-propeller repeat protein [Planctomycetales bacterium]